MFGTSEEAMKGRGCVVSTRQAVAELRAHGIEVVDTFERAGRAYVTVASEGEELTHLPCNSRKILEWLGY